MWLNERDLNIYKLIGLLFLKITIRKYDEDKSEEE